MAEKPIIFSTVMVRAILDGRKTVTRRIIKPQPVTQPEYQEKPTITTDGTLYFSRLHRNIKMPSQVGDILWVKEGWRCTGGGSDRNIIYKADGDTPMSFCGIDDGRKSILHVAEPYWAEWDRLVYRTDRGCNWRSARFMFKWAARLWLEVLNVRPERLQDTTNALEEDAMLWDKLNKSRGYSWDSNPWIWRYEFRRLEERR